MNTPAFKSDKEGFSVGQYCGHQRRGLSVECALVWTASHTRELSSAGAEEKKYSYLDIIKTLSQHATQVYIQSCMRLQHGQKK